MMTSLHTNGGLQLLNNQPTLPQCTVNNVREKQPQAAPQGQSPVDAAGPEGPIFTPHSGQALQGLQRLNSTPGITALDPLSTLPARSPDT